MPTKIKVLVWVWIAVMVLQIALVGLLAVVVGSPILLIPVALLGLWDGWILYVCRQVWQGNGRNAWFLKGYGTVLLISIPIGTVVGIMTWMILGDSEVKKYLGKG